MPRSGGRTANRGLQITVRLRAIRSNRWPPCRPDWAPVQHLDRATSGCKRCGGRTRAAGPTLRFPASTAQAVRSHRVVEQRVATAREARSWRPPCDGQRDHANGSRERTQRTVALDQSGQLEVLDARKAAGVDDRIHQAAQTGLPGLDRLLVDRHPQARGVVAAGRPALTAVMTLSGWSPGQVAHRSGRVLMETFRITGGIRFCIEWPDPRSSGSRAHYTRLGAVQPAGRAGHVRAQGPQYLE
jgi:hypothetical protein